jgi:quercetin dioxygenase-like cupin family protein
MRMIKLTSVIGAAGIAIAVASTVALAHGPEKTGGPVAVGETVTDVFERAIPNIPGKTLTATEVSYAPGGKSLSHIHGKTAFIYAHVISGSVRSQVGDEPAKVYQTGEGWYENPGSHHRVSENASTTEPAKILAVVIADDGDILTVPEHQ